PSASPSKILGVIKAEGQVYLINRNGVIFGGSSQVNVGSLLASGLDLAGPTIDQQNQRFLNGTLFDLAFTGPSGPVLCQPGAQIDVGAFGRVLLFGSGVVNGGSLGAPDGQVMLAAGDTLTLLAPANLNDVRGYPTPVITGNGLVENDGIISTPR